MVKKQQMRWSPRGAHLLLQIRTRVLNDTLAEDYRRWYPDLSTTPSTGRTKPRSLPRFVPLSDYETLRVDLQTLFTHLGITTIQPAAA